MAPQRGPTWRSEPPRSPAIPGGAEVGAQHSHRHFRFAFGWLWLTVDIVETQEELTEGKLEWSHVVATRQLTFLLGPTLAIVVRVARIASSAVAGSHVVSVPGRISVGTTGMNLGRGDEG